MSSYSLGRLLGGSLLVAGSCIGAAMLGLPVLTSVAGFVPAELAFAVAWLFMLSTGLMLLECNLALGAGASIISMAKATLGRWGSCLAWVVYLFLFYTLMVALITGSGALVHAAVDEGFGLNLPRQAADFAFVVLFGLFVYYGTSVVDQANRVLMIGLLICYVLLVFTGIPHVDLDLLSHRDWSVVPELMPVMILSFGFHNLIPSLTSYLKGHAGRLRSSVLIGSMLPFFIYALWQCIIIGIVPLDGPDGLRQALAKELPANLVLHRAVGSTQVTLLADGFALFAMLTTLIGVALSFVDFLADGLGWKKEGQTRLLLCIMVLLPPLLVSAVQPDRFLTALNFAGGFGAVILFGILPPLMVYSGRYRKNLQGPRIIPGGKLVLALTFLAACAIFATELIQELNLGELLPADFEAQP